MTDTAYYVYALKDPRSSPAKPFNIGKGTGVRAWDHLARPDDTRKGRRIQEIVSAGYEVVVAPLVEDLSEIQAMKLEAELISAFGTEDSGGILTNSVLPTGLGGKARREVVVPLGVKEKAQLGFTFLKDAILEFAKANQRGITNSDAEPAWSPQRLWRRIEGLLAVQCHWPTHAGRQARAHGSREAPRGESRVSSPTRG